MRIIDLQVDWLTGDIDGLHESSFYGCRPVKSVICVAAQRIIRWAAQRLSDRRKANDKTANGIGYYDVLM